jgi:hypothetical protein
MAVSLRLITRRVGGRMRRGRFNAEGISIIVVAFTAACGADVHQQGSGKNPGVISHQQGSVKNPGVVAIPHALFDPSAADAIARGAGYSAWVELDKQTTEPAHA